LVDKPASKSGFALLQRPALTGVMAFAVGVSIGPTGLRLLQPQLIDDGVPIESISEIALLICLFCAGLRLNIPIDWRMWRIPLRLSTLTLMVTAVLGAGAAYVMCDMSAMQALLLGAIVAPTDSVVAADVGVSELDPQGPSFALAAESGVNNGLATTFVLLILGMMGLRTSEPAVLSSLSILGFWAAAGGFAVGWLIGAGTARTITLLDSERQSDYLEATLVFAAAALAYGTALAIGTNGFLAVFAAGVALCHGGRFRRMSRNRPLMPGVLKVASRIERLIWLAMVTLMGALVSTVEFAPRMLGFCVVLLVFVRPLAVRLGMGSLPMPAAQWRAINHGLPAPFARQLAGITLVVLVSSIISSGIAALPLRRPARSTCSPQ
jgi:NhaP-type Na+/H+ or K+/H+ antiporter